jgi:putative membrane protein
MAALTLAEITGYAVLFTPLSYRQSMVRRAACEHFLKNNVHTTQNRAAVLIYISLDEHCVEILVDSEIGKKVDSGTWKELADSIALNIKQKSLTSAICSGIETCASVTSRYYPPESAGLNELSDQVIER